MLVPTVFHIDWKTSVLPVKWIPPRFGCVRTASDTVTALPGTKLTTPGGNPASMSSCIVYHAERIAEPAGFQMEVPPMRAGAVGGVSPVAVKVKGGTAETHPSSPRRA